MGKLIDANNIIVRELVVKTMYLKGLSCNITMINNNTGRGNCEE